MFIKFNAAKVAETAKAIKQTMQSRLGMVSRSNAEAAIDSAVDTAVRNAENGIKEGELLFEGMIKEKNKCIDTLEIAQREAKAAVTSLQAENKALQDANALLAKQNGESSAALGRLQTRIDSALKFKTIKTNPDGSIVQVKTNLNGAKATRTVNSNGKTTEEYIETASGLKRRIKYNPETGKPTELITNTTPNGDTVRYTFDQYGRASKPEILNRVKVKSQKPTVVSTKEIMNPYYGSSSEPQRFVARKMSDGSVEIVTIDAKTAKPVRIDKFPKDLLKNEDYGKLVQCNWLAESTYFEKDYTLITKGNKATYIYNNPDAIVTKRIRSTVEDEYGTKIGTYRNTFNKNVNAKWAELKVPTNGYRTEGIVMMRNGDKYVVTFSDGGKDAKSIVKICKNGTKCESDLSYEQLNNYFA